MHFYRSLGDEEGLCDLAVAQAAGHHAGDVNLAVCKDLSRARGAGFAAEHRVKGAVADRLVEPALTGGDLADAADDLARRLLFQDDAVHAVPDGLQHFALIDTRGEEDYTRWQSLAPHRLQDLQRIQPGHPKVGDEDVGAPPLHRRERLHAVRAAGDDLNVRLG